MQTWQEATSPVKDQLVSYSQKLISAFFLQPFPTSSTKQIHFFCSSPGRSTNSGHFGLREGVNSKSWKCSQRKLCQTQPPSLYRKGSISSTLVTTCWEIWHRKRILPRESQQWKFKAVCVTINILKTTGLHKTVFLSSHMG